MKAYDVLKLCFSQKHPFSAIRSFIIAKSMNLDDDQIIQLLTSPPIPEYRTTFEKDEGKIFDRTFSDHKLTREEFSKKYWLDGDAVYQYYTPNIEDGRDEREQFIFNDLRALKGLIFFHAALSEDSDRSQWEEIQKLKRGIKITAVLVAANTAVIGMVLLFIMKGK